MLRQLDIKRGLFPDEYKSMQSDDKQVFYIEHENSTAITRGVAILISDVGTSMVSQQGLAPLAAELNKIGWATVLLSAPELQNSSQSNESPTESPADENAATVEPQTDAETSSSAALSAPSPVHNKGAENRIASDTFDKQQEEFEALLKVGVKKSAEYPGFYIVIAQGSSAAWITKIYSEFKSNTPDAYIAVSPFWPDRSYNLQLPKIMAKTPMPVLDIYDNWDNDWVLSTVKKREMAATRSLKLLYRQRQLIGANQLEQQAHYLSKEIHGWLSHMGW